MTKLDTSFNGGHPLTLADFNFIQEAWRDSFVAAVNMLRSPSESTLAPSFIIAGCAKTSPSAGVWAISEGYMVYEGEICYVPAHTLSYSNVNDPLYWTVEQTAVAPSPVEYKDLSNKNVHLQRRAKVTTTSGVVAFNESATVSNILDAKLRGESGTLTLINGWDGNVTYRVIAGRVTLFGSVSANSNTIQGNVISNIPAAICPWIHIYNNYCGLGPATDSIIAGLVALDVFLNGGNIYPATRLHRLSSNINVLATTAWPLAVVPKNLTGAAPRTAQLRVWNPINIPGGYDYVVYNVTGISWDIAAKV